MVALLSFMPELAQACPTMKHILLVTFIPVGAGATVGTVVVGVPVSIGGSVGISVGILHSTWEGSGLQLPSIPHVALRCDGTRPGC